MAALERAFREIAATRMAGVALCHPGLEVQALGFEPCPGEPQIALGVLVTPWFMNLVRLPVIDAAPAGDDVTPRPGNAAGAAAGTVGATRPRELGGHRFEFLTAHEPALGDYESCSLFSPMFEFADQAAACATATEVLRLVRQGAADASSPATAATAAATTGAGSAAPGRRAFLFGRDAAARA